MSKARSSFDAHRYWLLLLGSVLLLPGVSWAHSIVTFEQGAANTTNEITIDGPYLETVDGVTVSLSSTVHLHMGDWSGDGNPDLRNHAGITDTFNFSEAVNIIGFDVVSGNQFGADNIFTSETGNQFSVNSLGFFDVANSAFAADWQNITSFTWRVLGDELVIDNLQFEAVSAVPVPAAIWLFGPALLA
jgi:hypothetical protein